MTFRLLLPLCGLFAALFGLGTLACLPLYHWQLRHFLTSSLWLKIRWWLPIFAVFCVVLWFGLVAALLVAAGLIAQGWREWLKHHGLQYKPSLAYLLLFSVGLACIPLFFLRLSPVHVTSILIVICFASVLSDVGAFFAGSYLGKHPLPAALNRRKSWEGVAGQLVGALLGTALAASLPHVGLVWLLGAAVGIGSAAGDLINSRVKRILGLTDWGNFLPGHGGALDRFASLSIALGIGYVLIPFL